MTTNTSAAAGAGVEEQASERRSVLLACAARPSPWDRDILNNARAATAQLPRELVDRLLGVALQRWRDLPDDERNDERPWIMGFNAGWDAALEALRPNAEDPLPDAEAEELYDRIHLEELGNGGRMGAIRLRVVRRFVDEEKRRVALGRMTAMDEEMEAKHPGWMTGVSAERGSGE